MNYLNQLLTEKVKVYVDKNNGRESKDEIGEINYQVKFIQKPHESSLIDIIFKKKKYQYGLQWFKSKEKLELLLKKIFEDSDFAESHGTEFIIVDEEKEHKEIYKMVKERKENDNGIRYSMEDVFNNIKNKKSE